MAAGRFGEDNGEPIDLAFVKVGAIKVDMDKRPARGDKGLVVLSYEVTSTTAGPVGGKDQSTLALIGNCRVIGAVPLPEGFDRQKLWDTIDADVASKKGRPQFEFGDDPLAEERQKVEMGDGPATVKRSRRKPSLVDGPGPEPEEGDGDGDPA